MILYHRAGRVSAPRLAAFMGLRASQRLVRPEDTVIRWGTATAFPHEITREINPRASLRRYYSRFQQLTLLQEGAVPVPEFSVSPIGYPSLGRDEGLGRQTTRGRGITFYPTGEKHYREHSFYTRFHAKERQFRVHVIGNNTRTRELVPDVEANREQPIWNHGSGFTYRVLDETRPKGVIPAAELAVRVVLKLDFGAVDVIWHDGRVYVLEVNTSPGLGDLTLQWYAENLAERIGLDSMPGWDAIEKTNNTDEV